MSDKGNFYVLSTFTPLMLDSTVFDCDVHIKSVGLLDANLKLAVRDPVVCLGNAYILGLYNHLFTKNISDVFNNRISLKENDEAIILTLTKKINLRSQTPSLSEILNLKYSLFFLRIEDQNNEQ